MSFIYNTCIKYTYHMWTMSISKVKCIILKPSLPVLLLSSTWQCCCLVSINFMKIKTTISTSPPFRVGDVMDGYLKKKKHFCLSQIEYIIQIVSRSIFLLFDI